MKVLICARCEKQVNVAHHCIFCDSRYCIPCWAVVEMDHKKKYCVGEGELKEVLEMDKEC